jgi:hypothetical protein
VNTASDKEGRRRLALLLIHRVCRDMLADRWANEQLRRHGDVPEKPFTIRQRALNGSAPPPDILLCGWETPSPIIGAPPKRQIGMWYGGHCPPPIRLAAGSSVDVRIE